MLCVFNGFCRLGYVFFNSIHNSILRIGYVLRQRSDLNFKTVAIFMMTNMNVQDWPIFVFLRIQPLARVLGSLRGGVYSLHKCTIPLGTSASSVMKYCPLLTVFKPTLVWITSGRQIVVRIVARILATSFTVAVHRYEGQQLKVQKEFPSCPNVQEALDFLDSALHVSAAAP